MVGLQEWSMVKELRVVAGGKNFEHKGSTETRGLSCAGPWEALVRHCFDILPGDRNYFWFVVFKYDGSNIRLHVRVLEAVNSHYYF
eukprot:3938957-Pyramimonas_sp.AAC.1